MRAGWLWGLVGLGCVDGDGSDGLVPPTQPTPTQNAVDADMDGFTENDDCDDTNADIYPGAPDEPYDGVDADCAGDSDFDADGDGFDSDAYDGDDCDDANDQVFPGGTEMCDGLDGDCDGIADSPLPTDAQIWYADTDGDRFGDPDTAVVDCAAPEEHVADGTDCDDGNSAVYPGAPTVVCDGFDNDCDPLTDEPSQPATIGATSFSTLQEAVQSASPGDVIDICEGLHEVTGLSVTQALTIQGLGDPMATRIEPTGSESVITIATASPVTLARVSITNGDGTGVGNRLVGGGLYVTDSSVTLEDVVIYENESEIGAGIFATGNLTLTLENTVVRNNSAFLGTFGSGGGIVLEEGADLVMSDSAILDNEADFDCGGIDIADGTTVDGSGTSVVAGNEADLNGGGICANFGGTIRGLTVEDNEAISAGGIYGTDLIIDDTVVIGNYGSVSTGGILTLGDSVFTNVTIDGNIGDIDVGGLSVNGNTASVELIDCTVVRNFIMSSLGDAGGVELFGASLVSTNTVWGEAGDANLPTDVWLGQTDVGFDFNGVATFTCDDATGTCQ